MDDYFYLEKLGNGLTKNDIPKEIEIEINKKINKLLKEARSNAKESTCFYCKTNVNEFCNSHTIPRFCLENISENGDVAGINAILGLPNMGIPITKESIGINSSGTFQIICRNCDSKIFQNYENPENYQVSEPKQIMLAEIAMKNYLKFISKRKLEIELFKEAEKIVSEDDILCKFFLKKKDAELPIKELDLRVYTNKFNKAKKTIEKGDVGYYCIYYKLLNYVAPIAVQAPVALAIDIEGKVVNELYNYDPHNDIADLHVCIFPLKEKTAIILFLENGEKKYRNFYKQFRKKSKQEQLGIINYIVFLYCEDYFIAKSIKDKTDLTLFKKVAEKTSNIYGSLYINNTSVLSKEFSLSNWNIIPNLLSEEYKLR